jgi:hypothetical protein
VLVHPRPKKKIIINFEFHEKGTKRERKRQTIEVN